MFSLKDAAIQGPVEAQWLFDFRRCWRWCRAKLLADVSEPRVKGEGVFHWFVYERKYINKYKCLRVGGEVPPSFVRVDSADEAGHQ